MSAEVLVLVQELHDRRRGLIEANRERLEMIEAKAEPDAELQATYDKVDDEITQLGQRIQNIMAHREQAEAAAKDREKFESMLHKNESMALAADGFAERMKNFLKAAAGEAVLAPRYIDVNLNTVHSAPNQWGKMEVQERHDLTKGTATDGAELIPTGFVRTLYEHLIEFAAIRQTNATVYTTSSGENLLVPKTTTYGSAALVAEGAAIPEDDPQFAQVTLNAYKYGQLIQTSYELLQDSAIDVVSFLARSAGRTLGLASGAHFITGTGTGQPQGIANSPTVGKTGATGQTTTWIGNDIIDLYHSVVSGYRVNGYWVMNDSSAAITRKIRDDTGGAGLGNFLWQPGLQAGMPDTLLGRPVVTDPGMAAMAANAHSVAFGDFSLYYAIRDVNAVRFERSDDFAFANDLVTFRVLIRTDGKQVVNGSTGAVKFYRNSAT